MKKLISLALALLILSVMAIPFASVSVLAADAGDGTEENPYQIGDADKWSSFAEKYFCDYKYRRQYYILTADIAISESTDDFYGYLDGNGHRITLSGNPLFITNSGNISNIVTSGTVGSNDSDEAGAFCISNWGTIKSCINICTVVGGNFLGGICNSNGGTVEDCINRGNITGTGLNIGGICGDNSAVVSGSVNRGEVCGSEQVGGICGYNPEGAEIVGCANHAAVTGDSFVGSICGANEGKVELCVNTASPEAAHGEGCDGTVKDYWNVSETDDVFDEICNKSAGSYEDRFVWTYIDNLPTLDSAGFCLRLGHIFNNGVCDNCGLHEVSGAGSVLSQGSLWIVIAVAVVAVAAVAVLVVVNKKKKKA